MNRGFWPQEDGWGRAIKAGFYNGLQYGLELGIKTSLVVAPIWLAVRSLIRLAQGG